MSDVKEKPVSLTDKERRHLEALASTRPFWRDVLDKALEWDRDGKIALFQKPLDMLRLDMEKFPSIVADRAVRNRPNKDGKVSCWRSACNEPATVAIDGVGVCREHRAEQNAAAESHKRKERLFADIAGRQGDEVDA